MQERELKLPVRYYTIRRVYGPGMPESGREGPHEKTLRGPAKRFGLVSVHCWNIGEADGPYPMPAGARPRGEAGDWVIAAGEITSQRIRPAMEVAREAGVTVFHLAQPTYACRYPSHAQIAADPELKPAEPRQPFGRCPRPRPRDEQWADEYGPDFPGAAWETHTEAFDIAAAARPAGDEPVVTDGWQLNGLCRRLDVDTLVYVGFMADICLMNSSGAIREMSARFGYRCVVLRDCTVAYEFADSHKDGWMTRAAIRLIETGPGYSASSEDFIAACRAAAGN